LFCWADGDGRGGRGRSRSGAGTGRATLFFEASHSGRGALGSLVRSLSGTLSFELPRSGTVGAVSFSVWVCGA